MNDNDPFAPMCGAPWMNRRLSPSGRAAAFLRRELEDFPAIEGRDPNRADLDAIVKRTVDTMVPIFRREQEVAARTDPQPEPPPPEPNIFRRWRPILGPMLPEPPPIDFEPLPEPAPDPKDEVPPSRYPGQNIG